jgi:hypothetical protein
MHFSPHSCDNRAIMHNLETKALISRESLAMQNHTDLSQDAFLEVCACHLISKPLLFGF